MPLLVIDTGSGRVLDRWSAPDSLLQVSVDVRTGRVWGVADQGGPAVWELFADRAPKLWYRLPVSPPPYPLDAWWGNGSLALDPQSRRGAFTSPDSDTLALLDLDSGVLVNRQVSADLWHGVAMDTAAGVTYAQGGGDLFSFRSSDGVSVFDDYCGRNTHGLVGKIAFSPATRTMYATDGSNGSGVCNFKVDQSPPVYTYSNLEPGCNAAFPCGSSAMVVDGTGSRLYVANPAYFDGTEQHLSSITYWDLTRSQMTPITDLNVPTSLVLSRDGSALFVSDLFCSRIGVYDARTGARAYDIATDGTPYSGALSVDGTRLYMPQFPSTTGSSRLIGSCGPLIPAPGLVPLPHGL